LEREDRTETDMADLLQYENIIVSEQGVFEFRSGRQIDGVPKPEIAQIRVAYVLVGNLVAQIVVGIILLAIGFLGGWWEWQEGYHYVGRHSAERFLQGMAIVGLVVLWDALKRRYVLFVTGRDGRCHKLLFSRDARPSGIEPFLQNARRTFGLAIQSDVKQINI
jgi:hypothetical protein